MSSLNIYHKETKDAPLISIPGLLIRALGLFGALFQDLTSSTSKKK